MQSENKQMLGDDYETPHLRGTKISLTAVCELCVNALIILIISKNTKLFLISVAKKCTTVSIRHFSPTKNSWTKLSIKVQ